MRELLFQSERDREIFWEFGPCQVDCFVLEHLWMIYQQIKYIG